MKRNLLLVVLAAALLAGAQPAWGDFYVIAVPAGLGTPITSLPYTITQPGFYHLKGNLTSTGDGITVQASNVTLDLMGFCISGPGSNKGIDIGSSTYENVEVRNGTVRNFAYGIYNHGYGCRLINLRAEHNTHTGILSFGRGVLIKECNASFNGSYGFEIINSCNIIENVAKDNGCGFFLNNDPLQLVDRNVASENATNWFKLTGCTKGLNTP